MKVRTVECALSPETTSPVKHNHRLSKNVTRPVSKSGTQEPRGSLRLYLRWGRGRHRVTLTCPVKPVSASQTYPMKQRPVCNKGYLLTLTGGCLPRRRTLIGRSHVTFRFASRDPRSTEPPPGPATSLGLYPKYLKAFPRQDKGPSVLIAATEVPSAG